MKMKHRMLALLLSIALIVTYMPVLAFAGSEGDAAADAPAAEAVTEGAENATETPDETGQPETAEADAQAGEQAEEPAPEAEANGPAEAAEEPAAEDKGADTQEAKPHQLVSAEPVQMVPDADIAGSDELLENYFDKKVDEALGSGAKKSGMLKAARNNRRSQLNDIEKQVYDLLLEQIQAVAEGQLASTEISVDLTNALSDYLVDSAVYSNCPKAITYQSLGLQYAMGVYIPYEDEDENGEIKEYWDFSPETKEKLYDANKVINALMTDQPQYLYWFDKTAGYKASLNAGLDTSDGAGSDAYIIDGTPIFTVSFTVAEGYRAEGAGEYTFDTDKTAALKVAVARVEQILAETASAGGTDLEKITAFKDAVCGLTSYNSAAVADPDTPYGDPWQMIYVFDGKESTEVVCEGYSKAFQYLCDKADTRGLFRSSEIDCHTVTGIMRGAGDEEGIEGAGDHMWNILHMDDGRNYIADITNSDAGTIGQNGKLFVTAALPYESYYSFSYDCNGDDTADIFYEYSDKTLSQYDESELSMSTEAYAGPDEPVDPKRVVEHWSFSKANGKIPKILTEDSDYGSYNERLGYFVYKFNNEFMFEDGDTITVKYADEADELTYTFYGYDDELGLEQCFARQTEDGRWDIIDYSEIKDDLKYSDGTAIQTEAWNVGDEGCQFRLFYNGVEFMLPFEITAASTIEFIPANPIEYYENTHGYYTGEEGSKYYYYEDNLFNLIYTTGSKFVIDGVEYIYESNSDADTMGFYSSDGEEFVPYGKLSFESDQSYDNQWTVGDPGTITIYYNGGSCTLPVTILENPVHSFSFEPGEPIVFTEDIGGYMTADWDEEAQEWKQYFAFYTDPVYFAYKDNSRFIVNDEVYTYGYKEDYGEGFFNSKEEAFDMAELICESDQSYDNPWTAGKTGTITLSYMGQSCEVPVTIVSNNPELTITYTTSHEFVENTGGYWKTDGDNEKYYQYIEGPFDGDVITVNGTEYTYDSYEEGFYSGDEYLDASELFIDSDQYTEHWLIPDGETETEVTLKICYKGVEYETTATLKKSNIEEITYIPVHEYIDLYENVSGYSEEGRFYYRTPIFETGDKLIINDRELGERTYIYDGDFESFVNEADENDLLSAEQIGFDNEVEADNVCVYAESQIEEPWTLTPEGKYYETTVTYGGVYVSGRKIRILENPVESISFSRNGESRMELIEGKDSYPSEGEETDSGYEYYSLYFLAGDIITVTMNNGEQIQYEYRTDREDENCFVNVDDESDAFDINDDKFDCGMTSDQDADHQWKPGNEYEAYIKYHGRTTPVTVAIKENPVTEVSFEYADGSKTMKLIDGVDGETVTERVKKERIEYFKYYSKAFETGDKLTVTKNGLMNTYVLKNNVFNGEYYTEAFVNENNPNDVIYAYEVEEYGGNQSAKTPWTLGGDGYYFTFKYYGVEFKVPVEIIENPVASFEFQRDGYDADHPIELTEGVDAWLNSDGGSNRWFEYYLTFKSGDTIKITDPEGNKSDYTAVPLYEAGDDTEYFVNEDGKKIETWRINQASEQSFETEWKPGDGTHKIDLEYYTRHKDVNVVIKENPVKDISFVRPGSDVIPLIENGDGYDNGWSFRYEINFKAGDKIGITYAETNTTVEYVAEAGPDGKVYYFTASGSVPEDAPEYINIYDLSFRHNCDYQLTDLEDGVTPTMMLMYRGKWVDVPVEIVDNPVESIEFIWASGGDRKELIENMDGWDAYYGDEPEPTFQYYLSFAEGDILKVKYAGAETPVSYVYGVDDEGWGAFSASGSVPDGVPTLISPEDVRVDSDQDYYNRWASGYDYEFDIRYLGNSYTVPVTIVKGDEPVECDHVYVFVPGQAATCGASGLREHYRCSECGLLFTKEGDEYTEAASEDLMIPATNNHTPAAAVRENEVAATCKAEGSYDEVAICSICHKELSRKKKIVGKIAHKEEVIPAIAATCTRPGSTEGKKCSVCGEILAAQTEVAALGHSWGAWTSASATEHQRVCGNDASHVEKAAHTWDGGKVTAAPTVEKDGAITFTCTVCGGTKTEAIPKLTQSDVDKAIADAEAQADDAAGKADDADKKAETSTNDSDVSAAETAAAQAAQRAAAVEAAAESALEQAQKTLNELPADASATDKAIAEANVANAEKNLEVAKQIKLATTGTVTKAKRAAAKVVSNRAAAAATAAKAAETTTDESKAVEAVNLADKALEAAQIAEQAAQQELDALTAAGATAAEKDEATKSLAEAKKITAAAYSAKAAAKKSAAAVASNKAAAASEAAKNTTDPAQAEAYRKQAEEEAAKAEALAGEAKEASTAASTAAKDVKAIADKITDPAAKAEAGKAASEASTAATEASSAATDAGKSQEAAKESSAAAEQSISDRIGTPEIKLSKTEFTYKYKVKKVKKKKKAVATAQKPSVTVTLNGKTISADNYDVTYSNAKSAAIGQYKVTVTLKGQYNGSATATYTINPKAVKLKKVTKGKKSFTATWAKLSKNDIKYKAIDGYQIRYATKSDFSDAKTVSAGTRKAVKKVVKKLKGKKKYYVQLRTYKKVKGVSGGKLYSAWSKTKTVTTKK